MNCTKKGLSARVKALSMACLSSAAVTMCFLSGSSCSFVEVRPGEENYLVTSLGDEIENVDVAFMGLKCDSILLDNGTDDMVSLGQHFFHMSLGVGVATAVLAWILSVCLPPTKCSWITMAIMGSATAVIQIPLFLMFESIPCTVHPSRQTCSLGPGSYFNIASITLWIVMTIWAQLILPPKWDGSSQEKTRDQITIREIVIPFSETDTSTANGDSNKERDVEQGSPKEAKQIAKSGDKNAPISLVAYDEFDDISEMTPSVAPRERKEKKSQSGVKQ
ncbi:unnamed protein product [Cylindrotheca closterium]|uniref:Uncharacterized protein n=1 Tax=Cylindrotheca closterium TaxID=2856 RepID=A0AAD2JLJ4_9STRA|nr:unnamed protein product [Cylindrotheca closterium]